MTTAPAPNADLVLGVDVGTQGSKAGLYTLDGTLVADTYAEHTFDHLRPGWVEMDPRQIEAAVVDAIARAVRASGVDGSRVKAVALSGILCGPVFVDEDWVPVRPIIPFLDTRAQDEVAWLRNEVEPLWETESANASLDTYVMATTYEWVRRNEPAVHARISKILSLAPYIAGRLCGLKANDAFSDPSHLSGWIIGWNAATGRVSERQLQALGIRVEQAPRIVAPSDVIGGITTDVTRRSWPVPVTSCRATSRLAWCPPAWPPTLPVPRASSPLVSRPPSPRSLPYPACSTRSARSPGRPSTGAT